MFCFFPSIITTESDRLIIPAVVAVSIAMNMLSPVMILGSISDATSLSKVALVSCLSLFSKAINPRISMFDENISLGPSRYF